MDSINVESQAYKIQKLLNKLSKGIMDGYVIYVNVHPLIRDKIKLEVSNNVKTFPTDVETYEFLNASDMLITDYSSVFFDFSNTRKKIVLFCDDYDDYKNERGFSLDFNVDIPFKKVDSVELLIEEVNNINEFMVDDEYISFSNKFNLFDSENSSKKICEIVFENKGNDENIEQLCKKNNEILIFTGNLAKNGITTSLRNLTENIDLNSCNVILLFNKNAVSKKDYLTIESFDQRIKYIPMIGRMSLSPYEKVFLHINERFNLSFDAAKNFTRIIFQREAMRLFGRTKFDNMIHFSGYETKPIALFSAMDGNRTIYIHNDMPEEHRMKKNFNAQVVYNAWNTFENVAVVRDELKVICSKPDAVFKPNFKVVHNSLDIKGILEKGSLDLSLEISDSQLLEILDNNNITKFVNIGRFSIEKGHVRLIEAFEKFYIEEPNSCLIILGGYGKEQELIIEKANKSIASDRIYIISSMTNPYPLLSKCNCFILSSFHEGLPMVIFEAIAFDLPIISTDISGPSEFLENGHGFIVPNSTKGIEFGMNSYKRGVIKPSSLDLEDFNQRAVAEFFGLVN